MNKKAFTIIELIVIIVVIGVLVLLAMPKFTDYIDKAKVSKIKSDIKVVDNLIIEDESLNNELMIGGKVDQDTINSIGTGGKYLIEKVYNKKGYVKNFDTQATYYHLNSGIIDKNTKTTLGGIYIMSENDETVYYVQVKETDDWTINEKGNFIYTGTDKIVKIPDEIQGQKVNNHSEMFAGKQVEKVIRNSQSIKNMSYMFDDAGEIGNVLDVSSLKTSNVTDFSKMFRNNKSLKIFGLNNFDTFNAKNMEQMFKNSNAIELRFSDKFNTARVSNMKEMFVSAKVDNLVGLRYMDLSTVDVQTLINHQKELDGNRNDLFTNSNYTFKNMKFWKNELNSGKQLIISGLHEIVKKGEDNGDGSTFVPEKPEYGSHEFEPEHEKILGQIGLVMKENVSGLEKPVSNPDVNIIISKGSNTSGQIKTIKPQKKGSYSSDIKVSNNKGQLNGFFLYNTINNDSYEIDIEIFIENEKWKVMTTIYNPTHPNYIELNKKIPNAEPGVIFNEKVDLNFDPSENFHNYKINLKDNYVSFEIDNKEFSRWNGQFDFQPMRLYVGSFYTHWLDANREIYRTKFDEDDKDKLRNAGYEAYNKEGLKEKLDQYFGANKEYVMQIKNIKLNSEK